MRSVGFQTAAPIRIWAVTDGRAGIENQALGLAEAIARRSNAEIIVKRIALRSPWSWAPPGFVPAPLQATTIGSDPLGPPWPDLWIGCGRASIPFSMGVREWSRGRTYVVQLQDPRINPREFDLVVPPSHDGLEGGPVLPILGSCHRVTPERISEEAARYPTDLTALAGPRIAALIGGKSKRQSIGRRRARVIAADLLALKAETGGSLMVTLSRRTGTEARAEFDARLRGKADLYFTGEGPNPYFALLAAADALLVTADSVNMPAEAAATGKPVLLLPVDGAPGKLTAFFDQLVARECARWHVGALEQWSYEPLRETDRVARFVLERLADRVK